LFQIAYEDIEVLVLVNRPKIQEFLTLDLEQRGLQVRATTSPEEALKEARNRPPDVVLLDLGNESFAFLAQLRGVHSGEARNLPVLLLTEEGEIPDRENSLRYRLDDFLVRPFVGEELTSRVASLGRLGATIRQATYQNMAPFQEDLLLARAIQLNLLPIPLPKRRGVHLACCYISSEQLSGDFFDVVPLDHGATGFFLADVVGHGTGAALFTSFLKAQLLHWSILMQQETPGETLWDMNQALCKVFQGSGRFVTALYATFEPGIERLHFTNAGHPAPLYFPLEGGSYQLEGGEIPLGIDPGTRYQTREIRFAPGDRIFLLTDGVFEQRWHGQGAQFGKGRVTKLLLSLRDRPLTEAVKALQTQLASWAGDHPLEDDVNVLAIEATKL
jgi:sigma-B regulation protein RsbU (phosphoserine phosphatase)